MKKTALVIMAAGIRKPLWQRDQTAGAGRARGGDHHGLFRA